MNTNWTPEDFSIFARQVAHPIAAGKVWPIAAMILCDQRDAAIMVARMIARSGRKDGFAQSCAEFVTKHTGLN